MSRGRTIRHEVDLGRTVESSLTIDYHTFNKGDKVIVHDYDDKMDFTFHSFVVKGDSEFVQLRSGRTGGMHYIKKERLVLPRRPRGVRTSKTSGEAQGQHETRRRTKVEIELAIAKASVEHNVDVGDKVWVKRESSKYFRKAGLVSKVLEQGCMVDFSDATDVWFSWRYLEKVRAA